MIGVTPNFITSYTAINRKGHREEGTILSSKADVNPTMELEGYRDIEIVSVKENK